MSDYRTDSYNVSIRKEVMAFLKEGFPGVAAIVVLVVCYNILGFNWFWILFWIGALVYSFIFWKRETKLILVLVALASVILFGYLCTLIYHQ